MPPKRLPFFGLLPAALAALPAGTAPPRGEGLTGLEIPPDGSVLTRRALPGKGGGRSR